MFSFCKLLPLLFLGFFSCQAMAAPAIRISYGKESQQFGDLRLPEGKGPFPVIVLIHGGCWLSEYDLSYLQPQAEWFARQGIASWTIEYRRLGNEGGGWPGTFLDVGRATDALRDIAGKYPLDPDKVYAAGHSSGGQLALWLASRHKLSPQSDLFLENPVPIRGVLGLAAITDLETYRVGPPGSCGASIDLLLGGTPEKWPGRYAETSPSRLLPLGVPQVFMQGGADYIVSPESIRTYVKAAQKAGDKIDLLEMPDADHFAGTILTPESESMLAKALSLLTCHQNGKTESP